MITPNTHPQTTHPKLNPNLTIGAKAERRGSDAWHLEIPAGSASRYRLAQLDDYHKLPRKGFPWSPPLRLQLLARASHQQIPGTWGFGLWNDPFNVKLGFGSARRIPALPNAAWFFFASPPNYLSLRDDLPTHGCLAATFSSTAIPAILLALAALAAPLLAIPPPARFLRRMARRFVRQSSSSVSVDPMEWHSYGLAWESDRVRFSLDGQVLLETPIVPVGRLGLVIWVDNQYLALPPDGRFRSGTLENPDPVWIEGEQLSIGGNSAFLDNSLTDRLQYGALGK
ncbi:MAG: hypothetical protein A2W33_10195 [Chloroflexi bacterium RBG_16_52_11]|nr:MAG: hypothetical protein A2W33_10195 [Chloroflexi bacterium RBG_16_52_11]